MNEETNVLLFREYEAIGLCHVAVIGVPCFCVCMFHCVLCFHAFFCCFNEQLLLTVVAMLLRVILVQDKVLQVQICMYEDYQ